MTVKLRNRRQQRRRPLPERLRQAPNAGPPAGLAVTWLSGRTTRRVATVPWYDASDTRRRSSGTRRATAGPLFLTSVVIAPVSPCGPVGGASLRVGESRHQPAHPSDERSECRLWLRDIAV